MIHFFKKTNKVNKSILKGWFKIHFRRFSRIYRGNPIEFPSKSVQKTVSKQRSKINELIKGFVWDSPGCKKLFLVLSNNAAPLTPGDFLIPQTNSIQTVISHWTKKRIPRGANAAPPGPPATFETLYVTIGTKITSRRNKSLIVISKHIGKKET